MQNQIKKTYDINAPVSRIWEALIKPELIKKYFFGTEAVSDWKKGSTIFYRGTWEGKSYEDKGIIRDLVPEKLIAISYWSNRSGTPDRPENYSDHSYHLESTGDITHLTMMQDDNFKSEETRKKAWQHWDIVIDGLKKLVEKK